MQNHFAFFSLPEQFELDRDALENAYREIQKTVHPDRFVHAPDADKRAALQWASIANDAYHILRNPLKRASYLCSLNGFSLEDDSHPALPPDFIFEQIAWREELDNSRIQKNLALLEKLDIRLKERSREQMGLIASTLAVKNYRQALQEVKKMMFLQKFSDEITHVYDEIDSAG